MATPNPNRKTETRSDTAPIPLVSGKLPPQAVALEQAVLGAMLQDKKGVDEVIDMLEPEAFYKPSHRVIYDAISTLFKESAPIDILTVTEKLKQMGKLEEAGRTSYLVDLTQTVGSSAHIEFHARIVLQNYMKRELINISSEIIEQSFDETRDVFNILDSAETRIYNITKGNLKKSAESAQNLVMQAKKRIQEISNRDGLSGIPSGFDQLDKLTSGWQPSDLIIIAARPAMGKTAFVLSMARNMSVNQRRPVAVFSLEMSSVQLITRLISSETGLTSEKLRTGKLAKHEWEQLNVKVKGLEKAPLFIDDTPSLSIFELRAKARRMASQHNIGLIIIDYLQLMNAGNDNKSGNREQEISTISRNLKALAKELDIPVIALSQLSRAVETRGGSKRPLLSDLRESGAIEQDADIVSFIYRPEYYGLEQWDTQDGGSTKGQAEFIVAKHRNGGLDNIRLKFIGDLGKFENLDSLDMPFEIESKMNVADATQENGHNNDLRNFRPTGRDAFSSLEDQDNPFDEE